MSAWLTVVAAGVGCYLLRISLVLLLGRQQPSPALVRVAGLVMPAAFATLAAAALVHTADAGAGHAIAPLLGAGVTAFVATRRSSTSALVAGMTVAALATTIAPL